MIYLYGITGLILVLSFLFSKEKTLKALKMAVKKLAALLPPFIIIIIFVSLTLYFIPQDLISQSLGKENMFSGLIIAALLGSVSFIPGFIVFPLCGILKEQNVTYTVLSAFTTTLMMVGFLTFPIEKKYLGTKLALIRNLGGFMMALIVALVTGLVFGEISL